MPDTEDSIMRFMAQAVACRTCTLTHMPGTAVRITQGKPTKKYARQNDHNPCAKRPEAASAAASITAAPTRILFTGTLARKTLRNMMETAAPREKASAGNPPWARGMPRSRRMESSSGPSDTNITPLWK